MPLEILNRFVDHCLAPIEEPTPLLVVQEDFAFSREELNAMVLENSVPLEPALIDLTRLGIRELKRMARDRKVKRYSNLTKAQLIQALA